MKPMIKIKIQKSFKKIETLEVQSCDECIFNHAEYQRNLEDYEYECIHPHGPSFDTKWLDSKYYGWYAIKRKNPIHPDCPLLKKTIRIYITK